MKLKQIMIAAMLVLGVAACDRVEPGQVGVKVNLLGSEKGVDQEVLGPGRYWIGWNERLYLFPTFTQNYVWTAGRDEGSPNDESITFQTKEGLSVNADFGITYSLENDKIANVFQKYRKGVDEITDVYLRNMVRDALVRAASTRDVETIYGAGKSELIREVEAEVAAEVAPIGIKIESIYLIGEFRLPPNVIDRINDKIGAVQMTQQRQNEVAQSKAEADKKIEEARGEAESLKLRAEAQAEANRKLSSSINSTLVEWERLQVQKLQIGKWNGEMPRIVTGDGGMLLQVQQ